MHGDPVHVLVLGDGAESTAQQLRSEGIQATCGTFDEYNHYLIVNGTSEVQDWPVFTYLIHLGPNQYIRDVGPDKLDDVQWATRHCGPMLRRAIVLVRP